MAKGKRFQVHAECPTCGCVSVEQMLPDNWREKHAHAGDPGKAEVDCPTCGARMVGPVTEVEAEE